MRVTTRLYLSALPSVAGVLAVAALAYWGQYARTVPEFILVVAVVTTLATVIMSWVNVRYVSQRVERLARNGRTAHDRTKSGQHSSANAIDSPDSDELDAIEGVVVQLNNAVQSAEGNRERELLHHQERRREYARVLASVAAHSTLQLDDVRLPLHILLENHFGELNENQEEMLGAARTAAERISAELVAMADLARLELGQQPLREDRVFPADILSAILPVLRAQTIAREVELSVDVPPLVRAFHVDASRLQQALQLLLTESTKVMRAGDHAKLSLSAERGKIVFALSPVGVLETSIQTLLARRTIEAMHGHVELTDAALRITMPT
ncbi:MAG: hypothetical protein ABI852_17940 [Gemmatimonadaceae bacterium]